MKFIANFFNYQQSFFLKKTQTSARTVMAALTEATTEVQLVQLVQFFFKKK